MAYGCDFCRLQSLGSYPKEKAWFDIWRLVNGCTREILGYNKSFKSVHNVLWFSPFNWLVKLINKPLAKYTFSICCPLSRLGHGLSFLGLLNELFHGRFCAGRADIRRSHSHEVEWEKFFQVLNNGQRDLEAYGRTTSGVLILNHMESQTL